MLILIKNQRDDFSKPEMAIKRGLQRRSPIVQGQVLV